MGFLRDAWTGLADLLWPRPAGCLWCQGPLDGEEGSPRSPGPPGSPAPPGLQGEKPEPSALCSVCRQVAAGGPVWAPGRPPLGRVAAVGPYGGGLGQAVRSFKYGRRQQLAASLGAALAAAAGATYPEGAAHTGDTPVLIPVPLHPGRLRERGFNQSELLAQEVAARLGWRLEASALRRVRATRSQAKLGQQERGSNLAGAFAVAPDWRPPPRVLIVDDVYTTGATAAACAAVLLAAGVERIDALALAIDR